MPVTIGQPVGRLHEVTTGIDVGQSRARLHPGVDDRHQLALTRENCQAAGEIQHRLAGRRYAWIGARDNTGDAARTALFHRRHRSRVSAGRLRGGVHHRRPDRPRRRRPPPRNDHGRRQTRKCGTDHLLSTQANNPTR